MASLFVDASLRALELFHMVVAFHTKVFDLARRGRAMIPSEAALEHLVDSLVGMNTGKRSSPNGFLEPLGPSALLKAFHASTATARTETAL